MSAQTLLMTAVQSHNPQSIINALDMGANPFLAQGDTPSALEALSTNSNFIQSLSSPFEQGAQAQLVVNKMLSVIPANHQEVVSVQRAASHIYRSLASQRAIHHTLTERAQQAGLELTDATTQKLSNPTQALAFFLGAIERSTGWKMFRQEHGELQSQQWVRQLQQHGAQEGASFAQSLNLSLLAKPAAAPQVGFDLAHSNNHQQSLERAPSLADGPAPRADQVLATQLSAPAPTAVYESDREALSQLQSLSSRPQSVSTPPALDDEISADRWSHLVPKIGAARIKAQRQADTQEPSRAPELSS